MQQDIRYNMVYSGLYECNEYNALYRHVVTFLFHDCDKLPSSVGSSEENRCREDAINMFRVRTTVIELGHVGPTVVCVVKI